VPPFKDQALCLRVWDWSETSQTAALLTRGGGLLRVLAKGSRRARSAFSGGLSPLTRGEATGIARPSARLAAGESAALTTLTAWDLQEVFVGVRRTLRSFYGAMHAAELLLRLVREGDPHAELFDDAVAALRGLADESAGLGPVVRLQWSALTHSGHRPEIAHDVSTGGALRRRAVYEFSPERGGLTRTPGRAGVAGGGACGRRPWSTSAGWWAGRRAGATGRARPGPWLFSGGTRSGCWGFHSTPWSPS